MPLDFYWKEVLLFYFIQNHPLHSMALNFDALCFRLVSINRSSVDFCSADLSISRFPIPFVSVTLETIVSEAGCFDSSVSLIYIVWQLGFTFFPLLIDCYHMLTSHMSCICCGCIFFLLWQMISSSAQFVRLSLLGESMRNSAPLSTMIQWLRI